MHQPYSSRDEAILDIMANTDARFRVAVLAASFVYDEGWQYNNGPTSRSVTICRDFDVEGSERITFSSTNY